jgi:hypothetical protein
LLRSERAQVATLRAQVASLTSQNSALKAQIAAIPTPLAVAVEQVRREVLWAENGFSQVRIPYSHGQLVANAAMDYVVGHVNPAAYGYMSTVLHTTPAPTPDSVLGNQAGICGDAALTFAAIVKRFGLQVRSVQFYYGPNGTWNHIADEVYYDGSWHFFDPTFGIFYEKAGNVLSISDARAANDPSLLRIDVTSFWVTVQTMAGYSETTFETDPSTVVTIDQQPFTG